LANEVARHHEVGNFKMKLLNFMNFRQLQATSVAVSTIFSDGLYAFIGVSLRFTEQH